MKDIQCRKWQLTINNPVEKGYTHGHIKELLQGLKPLVYFCMADETASTHHTHIFAAFSSGTRFSTLKNLFPEAHIEAARGTVIQNRDYINKSGKWEGDAKHGTKIPGTFEEYGDVPEEHQGQRTDLEGLYEMLKDGATDLELMEANPKAMLYLDRMERARQALRAEKFKTEFRQMDVTYLWGPTGVGKTRGIMEKYGYDGVCRVTDYDHPFERYNGEDVMIFDEYRSQLKMSAMLNYLDGYPLELPCRYANRTACYTKVYLISNVPLEEQYKNIQWDEPLTWAAFKRRIHHVVEMGGENSIPAAEQDAPQMFTELDDHEPLPF